MTAKTSGDLGTRVASAAVMIAAAGLTLWAGGLVFTVFVAAICAGLLWEWWGLVTKIVAAPLPRAAAMAGGVAYIGAAGATLIGLADVTIALPIAAIAIVAATDTCAFFVGRALGGPKIAPSISPSKTWSGLAGGMAGAAVAAILIVGGLPVMVGDLRWVDRSPAQLAVAACAGALLAVVAQAGDFFESWMKRRAGVKDSGSLIPGHGGLLDRADGLLPVIIALPFVVFGAVAAFGR